MISEHDLSEKNAVAERFSSAVTTYDIVANLQQQVANKLISLAEKQICSASNIVDLGCGTGYCLNKIKTMRPQASCYGVDISKAMLGSVKAKLDNCLICADMQALPLATGVQDLILASLVLQWCDNLSATLADINRVLTSEGKFIFSTLGPTSLFELKRAWQAVDDYEHVNNFIGLDDIITQLSDSGFRVDELLSETRTQHFNDCWSLLKRFKWLGANYVKGQRRQSLLSRTGYNKLCEAYEKSRSEAGLLPVTYEIIYIIASKV